MDQTRTNGASALGGDRAVGLPEGEGLLAFTDVLKAARGAEAPSAPVSVPPELVGVADLGPEPAPAGRDLASMIARAELPELPVVPARVAGTDTYAARFDPGFDRTITSQGVPADGASPTVSAIVTDSYAAQPPAGSGRITPDRVRLTVRDSESGQQVAYADVRQGTVDATFWPLRAGTEAAGVSAGVHVQEALEAPGTRAAPMIGPAVRATLDGASVQAALTMRNADQRFVAEGTLPVGDAVTLSGAYRSGMVNGVRSEEVEGKISVSADPVTGSVRLVRNLVTPSELAEVALSVRTGPSTTLSGKVQHQHGPIGSSTSGVIEFRHTF